MCTEVATRHNVYARNQEVWGKISVFPKILTILTHYFKQHVKLCPQILAKPANSDGYFNEFRRQRWDH